jgi:seryl-tRNA synthetase
MLDIRLIREQPDLVRRACRDKNCPEDLVERILTLDGERRELVHQVDELKHRAKSRSKEIGKLVKEGGDIEAAKAEVGSIKKEIAVLEDRLRQVDEQHAQRLLEVPNIPHEAVPEGADETGNVEVRTVGEPASFDFDPRPHWDLAEALDIIDFPRGTRIAGSGFILYKGAGARLERALVNFMLDMHTSKHGYREVFAPFLANRDAMTGTGQLPKFEFDMYRLPDDDLFLIPTAEVPVTNIYREEILGHDDLPIQHVAYSACFRREAGAAGKDNRGILRVHQFNKVEMVRFTTKDDSHEHHERLLADAEEVFQALGLTYRVVELCRGDLSFAAARCYDLEVYAPGVNRWLECSSCSNFEDFQARRMNLRYRDTEGKVQFCHTLNASGVALPRTVVALLETYQNADGSVTVPEALRPYMGGLDTIVAPS